MNIKYNIINRYDNILNIVRFIAPLPLPSDDFMLRRTRWVFYAWEEKLSAFFLTSPFLESSLKQTNGKIPRKGKKRK